MTSAPRFVGRTACSSTSTMGRVPPLRMQPRLFSSSVERPPALLPGVGWPARQSCPAPARCFSYSSQTRMISRWISGVAARFARTCSPPIHSMDSLIIAEAPMSTRMSLSSPTAGLQAMPDVASEPPHSMPSRSSDAGKSSFCCMPACCAMSRAARTAFSMVLSVPPSSWMPNETTGLLVIFWIFSRSAACGTVSQPRPMMTTP